MEAERKHAYAIRLQCWWRGILAVRTKTRTRRSLNETPLAEVEGGQESAAIAIQVTLFWSHHVMHAPLQKNKITALPTLYIKNITT